MRRFFFILFALLWAGSAPAKTCIVIAGNASPLESLAAREVRRYFYLRTGELARIESSHRAPSGSAIRIRVKRDGLGAEEYAIRTEGETVDLTGGSPLGALYAAYRFAEHLGVRFYVHGDVVPDARMAPVLPRLDETGKPLFSIRGIQPFHDFPEGPDWWDRDDYLSYIAQLPKLRMNFIGFHNYPEGGVGPEPGVWIGQPADIQPGGKVAFSYPSAWASTARPKAWGYQAMKTSEFAAGAGLLFEADDFGPEVLDGLLPAAAQPGQSALLYERTAAMFRAAFAQAKALGVKTAFGTETPLIIPKLVQERLRQQGKDPKDPAVVRELYEGMFRRIAATYPIDYYWLWTPEGWTWGGNKPEQLAATTADLQAALDALNRIGKPFTLATSGWVLGPQNDRAMLDQFLPKDSPMSTINRQVGHAADEPGFRNLTGRPKWVIPWVENDPNLTAPQPWAGRMRYDAADALRLGCTGLLGIHWRTKILAPNFAALAGAAWLQNWVPPAFDTKLIAPHPIPPEDKPLKGNDNPLRGRTMPVDAFYRDFAAANFGPGVAGPAGRIFASIDGVNLPEPTTWQSGPGGIKVEKTPWLEMKARYEFVGEMERLRDSVQGAGNRERFDYWLNTYRYMAAMAQAGCLRGELDRLAAAIQAEGDPAKQKAIAGRALPVRIELARLWEKMIWLQIAATDTPGELGTLANLEQHNRKTLRFLDKHDDTLAGALGSPLPAAVQPCQEYRGPARLIVPTVRTLANQGEVLRLKLIAMDRQPAKSVTVFVRPLGKGAYKPVAATHAARAVFRATLAAATADFEYYVEARSAAGGIVRWPATAPGISQTVVVAR